MATHFSILAWKITHGQRSLAGYSPWGRKESDMTETTEHALHQGAGISWCVCRRGLDLRILLTTFSLVTSRTIASRVATKTCQPLTST